MFASNDNTVLIQDQLSGTTQWLLFEKPNTVIQTRTIDDVIDCLRHVEEYSQKGSYAAGFISYEASGAMDPAFQTHDAGQLPLVWFGIYNSYKKVELPELGSEKIQLGEWKPSVTQDQYGDAIGKIKRHIRSGDTYQVNYTFRLRNTFSGDPWHLFLALYKAQRSDYCAYINLGRFHICSISPELFLSFENGKLTCKPMKGTVKRGYTTIEDHEREQWLLASQKNRAENVMIVDMIRNDMGSIAKTGSVRVEKLFSVEKYPTVLQMTSTVGSEVSAPMPEILRKMFPCASITGAPKVKTMEIIKNLEPDPRGIYTGSIGYVAPDGRAQFNVAIRTVAIDVDRNEAEYGVGGGIVWDSSAADEYDECKAKAAVLFQKYPEFDLIETMLWDPVSGIFLADYHIERLLESAKYFRFKISPEELKRKIDKSKSCQYQEKKKVRITLSRSGKLVLETFPIMSMRGRKVALACEAIPPRAAFAYHKTTNREVYANLLEKDPTGAVDVILWNDAGLVTESCIANVVISCGDEFVTPPLDCGLLPGVFRRFLLERGVIKEKNIFKKDLLNAKEVFLVNSVRGWMRLDRDENDDVWKISSDGCYDLSPHEKSYRSVAL